MRQIDIKEAKTHIADYLELALDGEEVLITQDDVPVLKLVSVTKPRMRRKAGSAEGLITTSEDFDEPLEDFRHLY
jgi:prevent-host-death family protein